jgi:hypothetical protein
MKGVDLDYEGSGCKIERDDQKIFTLLQRTKPYPLGFDFSCTLNAVVLHVCYQHEVSRVLVLNRQR